MKSGKLAVALVATVLMGGSAAVAATHPLLKPRYGRPGFVVDRVVIVMRHGVRPPTKAQPLPREVTREQWPDWPVAPGWLTPHGAQAIGRIGAWDGRELRAERLLPAKDCPAPGTVRVVADSDQRTIATAQAWTAALAPACSVEITHRPQDEPDPAFSAIEAGIVPYDPQQATAAAQAAAGAGGIAAAEAEARPLLTRLDAILCGSRAQACGLSGQPSAIAPAAPRRRPKLTGALDRGSTAAQVLLLEYAEGKPMRDVGWGRTSTADVTRLSALHSLEFRLLARPRYLARANFGGLAPIVREGLTGSARVTVISGHDTNIANLGGLLNVHWHVPGLAPDDPAPGGALVLQRLRAPDGRYFVRVLYRSQTLEQIRSAAPLAASAPYRQVLPLADCGKADTCPLDRFLSLLQ